VSYTQKIATSYLQSGLQIIANMNPQWGTSINLNSSALQAYWFSTTSYSSGNATVNYNLPGLGILGVSYQASCQLNVQIYNTTTTGQACLSVTEDQNQPFVTLGTQNFNFYYYNSTSSNWQLVSPPTEPTAYANGTYYINFPSGINPNSYVVQVEDQRGIITVASSFDSYNVAFAWNSTPASSTQTLYAHQETTTIAGQSYYLLKNVSADASGTILNVSAGSVGQQLMGNFTYLLTGVSSMPASTWTLNYNAWTDNAGITFDSNSSGNNAGGSTSSFSWSHTTGSGSNRIMIVGVSVKFTAGTEHVLSVSYGSQSLTFLRGDNSSGSVRSEIWYLVGPNTGTHTVTVTLSTNQKAAGGSVTYSGVSQTAPVVSNSAGGSGTSNSPSQSITVNTSNSLLVGNLAVRLSGSSAPSVTSEGTGQTMIWDNSSTYDTSSNNRGHGSEMGPVLTGSQTMSWTLSASANWAVSIVALLPAQQPPSVNIDVNILIRHSNGTYTTIATGVAPSANLTPNQATLSGSYAWANYTVVNQTDYLEIDYYADVMTASSGVNVHLEIDNSSLAVSNQTSVGNVVFISSNVNLYSLKSQQGTIVVELLQDGEMRWLGQDLVITNSNSTLPFPPVPVRSIVVNETINGVNGEVPFQIEDWAEDYQVPLGLTSNMSLFSGTTMLVFLATPQTSQVTIWWNGSDTATQTPYAYTNRYFNDSPGSGIISNGLLKLQFQGNFEPVNATVGTSSSIANFMRINSNVSGYGSLPSYVITDGVVRDIVHQEAEWSNQTDTSPGGVINCSNIYADIVITLPANATYYTYQVSLRFVQSQQPRIISDLCPVWLTSLTGQVQTENGTANGLPIVSNATAQFYNYSVSTWAHHWSQYVSGTTGAGIMFTDSANQYLYIFDTITGTKTGALNTNSTGTIQLQPVSLSQLNFNTTLDPRMQDMIWYGAIDTFNTSATSIYNNANQAGLWIFVEYPPTIAVTGQNN